MADMVARIRLVMDVPFEFDVPEAQYQPVRPLVEGSRAPGEEMANENQRTMARIDAAKHAESKLVAKLKDVLGDEVTFVSELVEEVREAEAAK